jgi:hypothetical protein
MTAFLKLHVPDKCHGIGIEFVSDNREGAKGFMNFIWSRDSDNREDARSFLEFMWSEEAELDGRGPFWQGSASGFNWGNAESTNWEFFEYFHCDPQDERVIEILFKAAEACNLPVE